MMLVFICPTKWDLLCSTWISGRKVEILTCNYTLNSCCVVESWCPNQTSQVKTNMCAPRNKHCVRIVSTLIQLHTNKGTHRGEKRHHMPGTSVVLQKFHSLVAQDDGKSLCPGNSVNRKKEKRNLNTFRKKYMFTNFNLSKVLEKQIKRYSLPETIHNNRINKTVNTNIWLQETIFSHMGRILSATNKSYPRYS
jgi:hypothetical protein